MASAAKLPEPTSVAVRHTPFTAIESPSASSSARRLRTRSTAPPPFCSSAITLPRSAISPVNIKRARAAWPPSPLAKACRDQQVLADALATEAERAHSLGDPLDPLALEGIAGRAAAEQQRRQEQPELVDLAGIEERSGEMRPTLEQHGG